MERLFVNMVRLLHYFEASRALLIISSEQIAWRLQVHADLKQRDAPSPRAIHAVGRIVQTPYLGGLHRLYVRV